MDDKEKVAGQESEVASQEADNTNEANAEVEIDWEAKYAKLELEKENYRKGLLKAKGKLPDDGEDLEEKVLKIVEERLNQTQESKLIQEQAEIVKRLAKRNKELTVALRNRAQVNGSTSSGGGQSGVESKTEYFSEEQKAVLRKTFDRLPPQARVQSFDDFLEKIKDNDLKLKK